jgi:predicted HTH domain antitoxin
MMSISVTFPEDLLVACKEDRDRFTRQVMIYTLGHLYEQGKISSGLGARVLGCDRREFYHLLSEHGFSVIDYSPDDRDNEARTSAIVYREVQDGDPRADRRNETP